MFYERKTVMTLQDIQLDSHYQLLINGEWTSGTGDKKNYYL